MISPGLSFCPLSKATFKNKHRLFKAPLEPSYLVEGYPNAR